MNSFKKGIFWAIVAILFGLLIFLDGCVMESDMFQYAGAFFIAVGILTADFVISEKKKETE